jgi:hypothetical protein
MNVERYSLVCTSTARDIGTVPRIKVEERPEALIQFESN